MIMHLAAIVIFCIIHLAMNNVKKFMRQDILLLLFVLQHCMHELEFHRTYTLCALSTVSPDCYYLLAVL